jgi:hypothetical protein
MLRTEAGGAGDRPRAVLRAWWPVAAALVLAVTALAYTRADADLWGHVRFGLDTLEHGLTTDDPYSFTQDKPWINHEWLSEVAMALAWRAGGSAGLALLKAALAASALWLIWSSLRGTRLWVRFVVMAVVAFGTVHMTATLRPQLWSFVAVAALCRTLVADRPERAWWLPVLFAVWANGHGGWVVGIGMLAAWTLGRAWTDRAVGLRWAGVTAASLAATLVTPYGWTLWRFVAETVQVERDILEWAPLWRLDPIDWLPWVIALAAGLWAVGRLRPRRLPTALVLLMLAYGAIRVMRLGSIYVVAGAVLLAPAFTTRWPARLPTLPFPRPRGEGVAAALIVAVLAAGAVGIGSRSLTCLPLRTAWMPDVEAARSLRSAGSGRLVTFFDWGEYAIWHFGPRLRVSMDGRRETVYSDTRLAEHAAIRDGTPEGLALLGTWQAEYVWLPSGSQATRRWLAAHGYRIDVETPRSFVAVREDLAPLRVFTHPPATGRCFPA